MAKDIARHSWAYGSSSEWLRRSEPMSWRRTYPGRGDQVAVARKFAATLFAGTGREDEIESVVAELISNAILHTRSGEKGGWFGLELAVTELAYVAVTDLGGGGVPHLMVEKHPRGVDTRCEALSEHGRGLRMVSELAVAIGIHGSPALGHTVWADLDLSGAPGRQAQVLAS
ncbi:ATP-binding protein [Spirillospora sp. CA-255316]